MIRFECAVAATRGARDYQEDCASFWLGDGEDVESLAPRDGSARFAVLADGMGGHRGGALASRIVCDAFLKRAVVDGEPLSDRLIAALEAANDAVADKVAATPMLAGMGATLIGVAFSGEGVSWVSVGDSPLYFFRRGDVAQLNEDHSLAPELDRLVREGVMSASEARRDPRRHMLRSAVTGDDIDLIDLSASPIALEAGDCIVLASDGIATLQTSEIARIIQAYARDGAGATANALIRAIEALREPHQDNATVVVVAVG